MSILRIRAAAPRPSRDGGRVTADGSRAPGDGGEARHDAGPAGARGGTVARRALLAAALIPVAGATITACSEEEPTGPAPVTEIGTEVPSPSGEVSAVLDTAGDAVGIVLRDRDGTDVWADDFPYTRDDPPGLLWQDDAERDTLWVLDTEGPPARITGDGDGLWRKAEVTDGDDVPENIAAWIASTRNA